MTYDVNTLNDVCNSGYLMLIACFIGACVWAYLSWKDWHDNHK